MLSKRIKYKQKSQYESVLFKKNQVKLFRNCSLAVFRIPDIGKYNAN